MEMIHPQVSPADTRRSASQGYLVIAEAPAAAVAMIGHSLLDVGAITAVGTYVCYIDTHDWAAVQAVVQASSVTGTIPVTLSSLYANRQAIRDSATPVNLSTSIQELELTGLLGTQRCKITFVLDGSDAMTFAAGSNQASPAALAEFNGQ